MNLELLLGSAHHSKVYGIVRDLVSPNPYNDFYWRIDEVMDNDVLRDLHWPLVDHIHEDLDLT